MGNSRTTTATAIAVAVMASVILLATSPSGVTAADPAGMGVASPSPYAAVDARNEGLAFENLPGFTRGAYERDHALITPESRVYTGLFGWKNTNAAWLITPAMAGGPQFSMYLVRHGDERDERERERFPHIHPSTKHNTQLTQYSLPRWFLFFFLSSSSSRRLS